MEVAAERGINSGSHLEPHCTILITGRLMYEISHYLQ